MSSAALQLGPGQLGTASDIRGKSGAKHQLGWDWYGRQLPRAKGYPRLNQSHGLPDMDGQKNLGGWVNYFRPKMSQNGIELGKNLHINYGKDLCGNLRGLGPLQGGYPLPMSVQCRFLFDQSVKTQNLTQNFPVVSRTELKEACTQNCKTAVALPSSLRSLSRVTFCSASGETIEARDSSSKLLIRGRGLREIAENEAIVQSEAPPIGASEQRTCDEPGSVVRSGDASGEPARNSPRDRALRRRLRYQRDTFP